MAVKQKIHVKKGDTVEIINGEDKGKRGKVLTVLPKEGRIIVQDVNKRTKHQNRGELLNGWYYTSGRSYRCIQSYGCLR